MLLPSMMVVGRMVDDEHAGHIKNYSLFLDGAARIGALKAT
jgi:hypothetical protein